MIQIDVKDRTINVPQNISDIDFNSIKKDTECVKLADDKALVAVISLCSISSLVNVRNAQLETAYTAHFIKGSNKISCGDKVIINSGLLFSACEDVRGISSYSDLVDLKATIGKNPKNSMKQDIIAGVELRVVNMDYIQAVITKKKKELTEDERVEREIAMANKKPLAFSNEEDFDAYYNS